MQVNLSDAFQKETTFWSERINEICDVHIYFCKWHDRKKLQQRALCHVYGQKNVPEMIDFSIFVIDL